MNTSSSTSGAALGRILWALLPSVVLMTACVANDGAPVTSVPAPVVTGAHVAEIAPDLTAMVRTLAPSADVDVIIQVNGAWDACGEQLRVRRLGQVLEEGQAAPGLRVFRATRTVATAMPASKLDALARCPGVVHISPDRPLVGADRKVKSVEVELPRDLAARTTGAEAVLDGAAGERLSGEGVTIAVVDSGIAVRHQDLPDDRQGWLGEVSFVGGRSSGLRRGAQDGYGHGTLVAGGIVSTSGVAGGLAPGARLISVQVLNSDGFGRVSDAIAAIEWIIDNAGRYGIRIINLSVASAVEESYLTDPLGIAVEAAARSGIVVVVAAGNLGSSEGQVVYGGVGSPANHPAVITVGATDPHGTVRRSDDTVAWFSSRGPTLIDGVTKPDLVAPGVDLRLPLASGSTIARTFRDLVERDGHGDDEHGHDDERGERDDEHGDGGGDLIRVSGTSFSAPLASATVALMLEAAPQLSPAEVKAILQLTAQPMEGTEPIDAGAGSLNTLGAVELALIWDGSDSLQPADPNLFEELPESPFSVIEGEQIVWGNGIIWNGYVVLDRRFLFTFNDVSVVGWLEGTGIIWNGKSADLGELVWLDYRVSGRDLAARFQEPYVAGMVWGTGIIWNGRVSYSPSASFGPGALSLWSGRLIDPSAFGDALTTVGPIVMQTDGMFIPVSGADGLIHVPEFR